MSAIKCGPQGRESERESAIEGAKCMNTFQRYDVNVLAMPALLLADW